MKYLGAKGDEKNASYQVYGSVRVNLHTKLELYFVLYSLFSQASQA